MAAMRIAPTSDRELAQAATDGDREAFAALYDRHERRAFNLAYRITGSREDAADATQDAILKLLVRLPKLADRELDFGAYLLTAVRHASYDAIARAARADPAEDLPESARPVGAAQAPGPRDAPARNVLLGASQEEIRAANATLAPRQREALALRELEGLSYDEIAVLMEMNRNSVAQLISRARVALRDALRRTALRSIPPSTPACERALALIATREDGQPEDGGDAGWLDAHLAKCKRCVLGREAMAEAGASYRIWAPVAAFEALRRETIARAGERLGYDWSAAAGRPRPPEDAATRAGVRARLRRDALAAVALATFLLLAVLAGRVADEGQPPSSTPQPPARAAAGVREKTARSKLVRRRTVTSAVSRRTSGAPSPDRSGAAARRDSPPPARDDSTRDTVAVPPPPPPPGSVPEDPTGGTVVTDPAPPPPPPAASATLVTRRPPPPPPRPAGASSGPGGSGVPVP